MWYEINPNAGKLFQEPYNKVGKIIYQDSLKTLSKINVGIDLFINDSDHSSEYEYKEYLETEKTTTSIAKSNCLKTRWQTKR